MKRFIYTWLLTIPIALSSQITLKKYDEPGMQGYKSIVFENVVEHNTDSADQVKNVVYDIQANNPYNNSPFPIASINRSGGNKYEINSRNKNEVAQQFSINADEIEEASYISSIVNSTFSENYAIVAYNEFIYSPIGDVHNEARRATIKVINGNGITSYEMSISSDVQNLCISPNGNYFSYSFGSTMHSSKPKSNGFRIIDVENDQVLYEKLGAFINVAFVKYGYIGVKGIIEDDSFEWLLDYGNGELFELMGNFLLKEYSHLKSLDGYTTITDLTPYKIK